MEISKERADELDAAWQAASDTQRLSMNRVSWFSAETTTYFEETPSKLELSAAAHIKVLEDELDTLYGIMRALVDSVERQVGPARELDPVDDFVTAMRDARSWLGDKR